MQTYLQNVKARVYNESKDDICSICDEKILYHLNKFLKDHVLDFFLSNVESFNKKLNLSDFYFDFDKDNGDIIELHIPNDIKETIRKILGRNKIQININL